MTSQLFSKKKKNKSLIHESQKFQLCTEAGLGSEGPKRRLSAVLD